MEKRVLFIYNPKSGRGSIARRVEAIADLFRSHGYTLIPHPINFDENPFAEERDLSLVVVAGGDGTINFVVNRMKALGLNFPLGVIPSGTANDFARALGMSRNPMKAARQILASEERLIDCGRVNDLYFVNIFSFGIFTTTSQRTPNEQKNRIGKLAYLIEGVKEVTTMHAVPLQVRADGEVFDLNSLMVLVFNGQTAGGFQLTRGASITDGKFDVVMVEKHNLLRSTWALGHYLLGGNTQIVRHMQVSELEIESSVQEPTDVDGQRGAEFPLHIECLKGALRIRCALQNEERISNNTQQL